MEVANGKEVGRREEKRQEAKARLRDGAALRIAQS